MLSDDLEHVFEQFPDEQIKLTLSSGDTVIVRSARDALISGMMLHLHLITNPLRRRGSWQVVSIPNIAIAEPYTGEPPPPRRRRGR